MDGFLRKFKATDESGKEVNLAIVNPTKTVLNESELKYAATMSKAIREGIMTRAECLEFIKTNNKWTDGDEQKIDEKRKEISENEELLKSCKNKEDGILIAKKMQELRMEILAINEKINSIIKVSAESLAENIRDDFLTSQCVVHEDTKRKYFSDYNDYMDKSSTSLAYLSKTNMIGVIYGIEENFIMKLPENQYLIKEGIINGSGVEIDQKTGLKKDPVTGNFLNENNEFVNENGDLVDEFGKEIGNSIDIEPKEEAKKRGRKKKE